MKDMVVGCASGKIDGKVVLDLNKEEDNFGEADLPIAIIPRTNEIVLLQMDGNMTKDELREAIGMSKKAALYISNLQKEALLAKYKGQESEKEGE